MPQVGYPEFMKYEQVRGVFVGGCVERGDGSRFRAKAHAHTSKADPWRGWICVLSPKRLRNPKREVSLLMWHELAHLVSGQGHTAKFEATMRALCGRSDVKKYRKERAERRRSVLVRVEERPYPSGGTCSDCRRNEATVHFTRIMSSNWMHTDALCGKCLLSWRAHYCLRTPTPVHFRVAVQS